MSVFGNIINKIFHHHSAQAAPSPQAAPQASAPAGQGGDAATLNPAATQQAPQQNVDVGAVLSEMAAAKGGGATINRRS